MLWTTLTLRIPWQQLLKMVRLRLESLFVAVRMVWLLPLTNTKGYVRQFVGVKSLPKYPAFTTMPISYASPLVLCARETPKKWWGYLLTRNLRVADTCED